MRSEEEIRAVEVRGINQLSKGWVLEGDYATYNPSTQKVVPIEEEKEPMVLKAYLAANNLKVVPIDAQILEPGQVGVDRGDLEWATYYLHACGQHWSVEGKKKLTRLSNALGEER